MSRRTRMKKMGGRRASKRHGIVTPIQSSMGGRVTVRRGKRR